MSLLSKNKDKASGKVKVKDKTMKSKGKYLCTCSPQRIFINTRFFFRLHWKKMRYFSQSAKRNFIYKIFGQSGKMRSECGKIELFRW